MKFPALLCFATLGFLQVLHAQPAAGIFMSLSDLNISLIEQGSGVPQKDKNYEGRPLSVDGRKYPKGIGTHSPSRLILNLNAGTRRFRASAGVDDSAGKKGSVRFSIQGDGKELWNSGVKKKGEPPSPIDLDVSSIRCLVLLVDDAGDGNAEDHADWLDPTLTGVTSRPVIATRLPEEEGMILPGRKWIDTEGHPIQAHGGGILHHEGRYYWYGENRSDGYLAIGVSGYVSDDLLNWKHLGLVLPREAYFKRNRDKTICERPKVIYNPATKKFVMWFHYDKAGYGDSQAGVAIADKPEGPFHYLGEHRPIKKSTYRDMGVFVDDDSKAYAIYAGEENQTMHVVRLNAEWTEAEKPMVEGETWSRIHIQKARESPAVFKHEGKYYLFTSGTTGWNPNPADLSVADNILGPYRSLGSPCTGPNANTTFRSQNTYILPAPGKPPGHFIYMGDRWNPQNLADSRYIWLPLVMENGRTTLEWKDAWKINNTGGQQ
ncbi:MAG: NPCBM/NEW2 domain-containing protein [Verrucomicrobiota bacterium]